MFTTEVAYLGEKIIRSIQGFGQFTQFCGSAASWLMLGVGKWGRLSLLMPQLYQVGTRSIPVVMLVGAFVGMVLAVEAFDQFAALGQESRLGGIINISVVKQIGPVLAAVMLAGRVGGAVSAELGTMKVTEQIDALRVMGADPIAYLVVPRVIACTVMVPILTVFSDLTGIFGGYFVTVRGFGVSGSNYQEFATLYVEPYDLMTGVIKATVFGLMIGLISCYKGFTCGSGAKGVGRAATDAFVASFVAIIVSNLFLAKFLKDFGVFLWGQSEITL